MDYSREPETMQSRLLDTTLASVGCTSSEDKEQILIAYEGEWRNLLSKLRSDLKLRHAQDDASYDRKHRRMVMMHNSSIVGEKIVKVARNYVKVCRHAQSLLITFSHPQLISTSSDIYNQGEVDGGCERGHESVAPGSFGG